MPAIRVNPYKVGNPVTGPDFFGREDILRQAENIFLSPGQPAVVIYGQRRMGKTSILMELKRRLSSQGLPVIYMDLMGMAKDPFGQLLYTLARTITRDLKLSIKVDGKDFDNAGQFFQEKFLPEVYAGLDPSQRLALLFDEFDVLDIVKRETFPADIAANRLFSTLQKWMREEDRLVFGFVVGRNLNDLDTDFWATFRNALSLQVSMLAFEAADQLLRRAKQVHYTPKAVQRVYYWTRGHPLLTQLFGKLIFEKVTGEKDSAPPAVSAALVDNLIPEVISTAQNIFAWIWDGLPPVEKISISTLAALLNDQKAAANREDIVRALQSRRIRIVTSELERAPDHLVEWQLLEKTETGYRFLMPVFHYWVKEHKPPSETQNEIDRINPKAQRYYEIGKMDYEEGSLEEAAQNYETALRINPDHVQARLDLAEVYLERGNLDEAILAFEEAYQRDEQQALRGLIQALFARASKGAPEQALQDYRRILRLDPGNQEAAERLTAIWKVRGDKALASGDYENARLAYQEGGLEQEAAKVQSLIESQARKLEQAYQMGVKHSRRANGKRRWSIYERLYSSSHLIKTQQNF